MKQFIIALSTVVCLALGQLAAADSIDRDIDKAQMLAKQGRYKESKELVAKALKEVEEAGSKKKGGQVLTRNGKPVRTKNGNPVYLKPKK